MTKIKVQLEFTDRQIANLLCSAIEGGIAYWVQSVADDFHGAEPAKPWEDEYTPGYIAAPFTEGGELRVTLKEDCVHTDKIGDVVAEYTITRKKLEEGLALMSEHAPRHFADFLSERDDATTGDVFFQYCTIGRLVFG